MASAAPGPEGEKIRTTFRCRRKRQIALLVFVAASFAFATGGTTLAFLSNHVWIFAVSLGYWAVVLAVFILLSTRNWRCPACNRLFAMSPPGNHCSRCGTRLR